MLFHVRVDCQGHTRTGEPTAGRGDHHGEDRNKHHLTLRHKRLSGVEVDSGDSEASDGEDRRAEAHVSRLKRPDA